MHLLPVQSESSSRNATRDPVRSPRDMPDAWPAWLIDLPKVELHVHLEGTVNPTTLFQLATRHGIDLGLQRPSDVRSLFQYRDFPHFIETFILVSDCLRSPEDFGLLVEEYGRSLSNQGTIYAEIHFSPEPHARRRGVNFFDMLAVMNAARRKLQEETGIELRWIADGVRDAASGPVSVDRTVDWMIAAGPESGIVALGLGGDECGHPTRHFASAFKRARDAGFAVVAHAGETTGPAKIWDAINVLGARRIGHGISAVRDTNLMTALVERQIPLELCPASNRCTGLINSIDALPIDQLQQAGVPFSINSDDPAMFGTSLTRELGAIMEAFGFGRDQMIALTRSAIDQSFADDATRRDLLSRVEAFASQSGE